MEHDRRGRLRRAFAVWLIGIAALLVYPPMQLVQRIMPFEVGEEYDKYFIPPPLDPVTGERVWDARTAAWVWADPGFWWTRGSPPFYRPHGTRLLAEIALWTAVVWAVGVVGYRAAAWPAPRLSWIRWMAMMVSGFAAANLGLALALGSLDLQDIWRAVDKGRLRLAAVMCWDDLACWGYGFLLPYAIGVWGIAALIAWRLRPRPTAEKPQFSPTIAWVGGVKPWPG